MREAWNKCKPYVKKAGKGISWVFNTAKRFEVIVTVLNLVVILWIVPDQAEATRAHQLVVSDYRGIRSALTPLRMNDEYTYDLCARKRSDLADKKSIWYFREDAKRLRAERMLLVANLVSAAMGMDESFNKKSYKEVEWFINWNNSLNLSYEKVCEKKLISGEKLVDWEKMVLREMRKTL